STARAQSTGEIVGRVIGDDGRPVGSATIQIVGTSRASSTAADGTFRLDRIPQGVVRLRATHVGMEPVEREVTVAGGASSRIEIILAEGSVALGDITVSARRSANERSVSIGKVAIAARDLPQS